MAVLFLTTVLPFSRRTGGEVVSHAVIDAVTRTGTDVRVLGYRRPRAGREEDSRERCVGVRPVETDEAGLWPLVWGARAMATGAPYSVAKYESRAYLRAVGEELDGSPDAVIVDHAQAHFGLGGVAAEVPVVFLAHNSEERLYADLAETARGPIRRALFRREARSISAVERQIAGSASQVWALSPEDAEALRALAPSADVRVLEVVPSPAPAAAAAQPRFDVGLIGNWTWRPNAVGLAWFIDEVAPRLPPDLTIAVAGSGAVPARQDGRRIEMLGHVADADEFRASARVLAVPARTGGGIQVQMLDSIRSGAPVVATTTAARGLPGLPASVSVSDDPEDFARELAQLARTDDRERARLAGDARAWSARRYERFERTVAAWLAEAIRSEAPPIPSSTLATH